MKRRFVAVVLALFAVFAMTGCGSSETKIIDKAAKAFKSGTQTVWVDPDAERTLESAQVAELKEMISGSGQTIFVAILPRAIKDEVDNNPSNILPKLYERTGKSGIYAAWAGDAFRGGAPDDLNLTNVPDMATKAYGSLPSSDTFGILKSFIEQVKTLPVPTATVTAEPKDDGGLTDTQVVWFVGIVVAVMVIISVALIASKPSNRRGNRSSYNSWSTFTDSGSNSGHHGDHGGFSDGGGGGFGGDGGGGSFQFVKQFFLPRDHACVLWAF